MEEQKIHLLVEQAQCDQEEAFTALFREYQRYLYTTALFFLGDAEDAADVMQDTYLAAFRSIKKLQHKEYFKTWITKILINHCHTLRNKRKKHSASPLDTDIVWEDPPSETEMAVWQAVNKLDEKHRTVIILRFKNDLDIRDIAKILGCSEGTVKSRIYRAIEKLKIDLCEE